MDLLEAVETYEELAVRAARNNLASFTTYTMPEFDWQPFNLKYYKILNEFAHGRIKNLIVSMPPQHGKTEGSTRRLPSYMFGLDPDKKIGIASYSASVARKFNRDNQRIIDSEPYHRLFPETKLNESNVVSVSGSYLRNTDEFEIVDKKGMLRAVGRGGALTSFSIDVMIMDDLYKDFMEGNSPVIRENAWDWYTSVVRTRLHNESQQLIVFTRWHDDDIIGRIEASETVIEIDSLDQLIDIKNDEWVKLNYEAIKTTPTTDLDQREEGEALWENKHSLEKLLAEKKLDPNKFECLHQGNPETKEGLLYTKKWRTYKKLPEVCKKKGNYTDTADSGDDFLCSISYEVYDDGIYVTDVLYTQEPMEKTDVLLPVMLERAGTKTADFESNNGGRYFAINVRKLLKKSSVGCIINWFHQSLNKESRILTNNTQVQQHIVFPEDWHSKWPIFWKHLTKYKRLFKANKQDGGPDVLTGIIEKNIIYKFEIADVSENKHSRLSKEGSTGGHAAPWISGERQRTGSNLF